MNGGENTLLKDPWGMGQDIAHFVVEVNKDSCCNAKFEYPCDRLNFKY